MEEGERNSSYFFSLEKRNAKRNSISALNINGIIVPTQSKYQNTLLSSIPTSISLLKLTLIAQLVRGKTPVIDNEFQNMCDPPLSPSEIKSAIMNMKKGKSPGVDGLTTEFYVHFWDILEKLLCALINECWRNDRHNEAGCHNFNT